MDKKQASRLVLIASLVVLPLSAGAQVYKWVDEDGKVHYSDKKPPASEDKSVELVDKSALEPSNTYESIDDGVDPDQLNKNRKRRESQREASEVRILTQQAETFRGKNCYSRTEDIRRGTAAGGARVIAKEEVKRCRVPIPAALQPYLSGYTYDGTE